MNCDLTLHNGLQEMGELICPFCKRALEDEKPRDCSVKYYFCCDCQDIINDNGMIVCRSCGIVQGYKTAREYVNFYENIHRIKRKSVYHRKYHLNNILMDIGIKHDIIFSFEIGEILPQINGARKRMMSLNFILRQVLKMMGIPYNKIPISKTKKTLAFYQLYWNQIIILIGDIIKGIIYGGKL